MSLVSLSSLRVGDRAVIHDISADAGIRQRLQAMGLRSGREACIVRSASLGGPIQVRVGSISLIMRRKDAERISVKPAA